MAGSERPSEDWADDIADLYIMEDVPAPPLPTMLPSERKLMPAYLRPLDDPCHRCVQGLCNDHAG
ncbi:MAG: hypothetical protein JWM19_974 [Actinomycetia bacterium]|nr:hypothetical protein [Actinomycetes bacterium]